MKVLTKGTAPIPKFITSPPRCAIITVILASAPLYKRTHTTGVFISGVLQPYNVITYTPRPQPWKSSLRSFSVPTSLDTIPLLHHLRAPLCLSNVPRRWPRLQLRAIFQKKINHFFPKLKVFPAFVVGQHFQVCRSQPSYSDKFR